MTDQDFIGVFASGNEAAIALAKGRLEAAGIPFFVKNEMVQDLFALGRFGTGFNPAIGQAEVHVAIANRAEALDILDDLIRAEGEAEPQ